MYIKNFDLFKCVCYTNKRTREKSGDELLMKNSENKMETMPMNILAFKNSMPIVLSMLSIALYGIIDTMFISWVGKDALTAVALSIPVTAIITAIALGAGIGVNSLLARTLGEKNEDKVRRITQNGLTLAFFSWILVAFVCHLGLDKFLGIFTKDSNIIEQAQQYLYIVGVLSIGTIYQTMVEKILEAHGKSRMSMLVQISGTIINLILDPILIFGYLGFPAMGIKGAAISTVLGQCFGMIVGLIILRANHLVRIRDIFIVRLEKSICKEIYKVGLSAEIVEIGGACTSLVLNKVLTTFSEDAVAVWGVYYQLQKFITIIVYGFNYGMVPILAYNYGAKNKHRIKDCMKVFARIVMIFTFIGQLVFIIFARQLIGLYTDSSEVMSLAIVAFRILALGFVFAGISLVVSSIFQAFGDGKSSLTVSFARQMGITLPFVLIFARLVGINGVWIAFTVSELLTVLIAIFLYKSNKSVWDNL